MRISTLLLVTFLGGCASTQPFDKQIDAAAEAAAPALPVMLNTTAYTQGLKCTGQLLTAYGSRASIAVESIAEKTFNEPAGVTEMFISAMSLMTARSSAVKTIALTVSDPYATWTPNREAGGRLARPPAVAAATAATYIVRGAVSQFDRHVQADRNVVGVDFGFLGKVAMTLGGSATTARSELALDLFVVRAADQSLVAGATSHNKISILETESGGDGKAAFSKVGVNVEASRATSAGKAVALRNLVERAAIEIVGVVTKTPWWQCDGAHRDAAAISTLVDDMYSGTDAQERTSLYLRRLQALGVVASAAEWDAATYALAIKAYGQALGQPPGSESSPEFFRAHLMLNPEPVGARTRELFSQARQGPGSISVALQPGPSNGPYRIALTLGSGLYAYCFSNNGDAGARQVHGAVRKLTPQGTDRTVVFTVVSPETKARASGTAPWVACLATPRDIDLDIHRILAAQGGQSRVEAARQLQAALAVRGVLPAMATLTLSRDGT